MEFSTARISSKTIVMMRNFMCLLLIGSMYSTFAQDEPPPPPPKVEVTKHILPTGHYFYKKNPTVKRYTWLRGNKVVLVLKDNRQEEYLMEIEEDKKKFEAKYGSVPEIPPPPPPKVDITKFEPPVRDPFYIRNPDVDRVTWSKGNRINVILKSGMREEYYLEKQEQKDAFIKKYGEPPRIPPPPPPAKKKKIS